MSTEAEWRVLEGLETDPARDYFWRNRQRGGVRKPPCPVCPERPWFAWTKLADDTDGVMGHYRDEQEAKSVVEAVTKYVLDLKVSL